jgi:predicted amidophosphoribosyltransferase
MGLRLPKCATCGKELPKLEKCQYCGNEFCEEDYPKHMAWERRHAGLAEEEGKFWRERREAPS